MSTFRKLISIVLAALLLLSLLPAAAEGEVVVKNYKELIAAINDNGAERILISAKYKHGTKDITNLVPDGRTVVIAAESGEETVIDGRVDIYGPCTVVFENVIIRAPQGEAALWVGKGAVVTIDAVYGGDSKNKNGGCGAIVFDAELTVGTAAGGNAAAGMGGDGISAHGEAKVTAGKVTGGNCTDGVGGAGAVCVGGAVVTITEEAVGGNGAVSAGKAVLTGLDASAEVQGAQKDGEILESKKAPDPEKISSYVLMENALRNGKTEIVIDSSYKSGLALDDDIPLFIPSDQTIRITGEGKNGKPVKITDRLYLSGGNWEISGIDIAAKSNAIVLANKANVVFSGNIACSKNTTLYLSGQSRIDFTGNIDYSGSNASACVLLEKSEAHITGNIKVQKGNAIYLANGTVTVRGNLTSQTHPAIYGIEGSVDMEGDIKTPSNAVHTVGGQAKVTVKGNITITGRQYALYATAGEIHFDGNIKGNYPAGGKNGKVFVNGEQAYPN